MLVTNHAAHCMMEPSHDEPAKSARGRTEHEGGLLP